MRNTADLTGGKPIAFSVPSTSLHRVNSTRTTFAFDAYFVWQITPLAGELNGFCHGIFIVTIDAIECVFNVANSYLAC
jgi:hypothetical protein